MDQNPPPPPNLQGAAPVLLGADQLAQILQHIRPSGGNAGQQTSAFKSLSAAEWHIWRRNFTVIAEIHSWSDLRCRREAKACMQGDAAHKVGDIDADPPGMAPGQFTINHLLDAYEARFVVAADSVAAKAEFQTATQRPDEDALQWHSRLRQLFVRAYPNDDRELSDHIRDRFLQGLQDTTVAFEVHKLSPTSFSDALAKVQRHMASMAIFNKKPTINAIETPPTPAPEINNLSVEQPKPQNSRGRGGRGGRGGQRGRGRGKGCWYCQEKGHIRRDYKQYKEDAQYWQGQFNQRGGRGRGGRGQDGRGRGRGATSRGGSTRGYQYNYPNYGYDGSYAPYNQRGGYGTYGGINHIDSQHPDSHFTAPTAAYDDPLPFHDDPENF